METVKLHMTDEQLALHRAAHRRKTIGAILQYTFAILLTLIMVFPLYWMVISSFKSSNELLLTYPTFWPQEWHPENYSIVMAKFPIGTYMINSLICTVATTLGQLLVGVFAAYAFSKGDFPGKDILFLLILGALMVPTQVTFIPTYIMASHLNWINTFWGLIIPESVSAYFIFMLRQNFKAVDESYLDAGRVDGMGRIGLIRHVLVPMNKPAVITVTVLAFINGWNSYFWPKMVTTRDEYRTVSIALQQMLRSFAADEIRSFNQLMAAALVCVIPVVVLFLLCQKYILTGFSKAAMK
ncbi:MAG: carbohydrate ABC transporter permease [Clostridia bacterium]|nr:carbohydrate ABC transporter permease [Clostridia bacterium]